MSRTPSPTICFNRRPSSRSLFADNPRQGISAMPKIESRLTQYFRETLGINSDGELSPYRVRSATPDECMTLKKIIKQTSENRTEFALGLSAAICSGNRAATEKGKKASVTPSTDSKQKHSPADLPHHTTGDESSIFESNRHPHRFHFRGGAIDVSGAEPMVTSRANSTAHSRLTHREHSTTSESTPTTTARGLPHLNSATEFHHALPSGRQSTPNAAPSSQSLVRPDYNPKRVTSRNGVCTTPFFHLANQLSKEEITKMFDQMCEKIEAKASGSAADAAAQHSAMNFKNVVANLIKLPRPVWTMAKRYIRDNVPTNAYRLHLKALWKFAAGRIIVEQAKVRTTLIRDARKKLMELQKQKQITEAKEKKKRRGELAVAFFAEVMPKKASKVPPLTEEVYRSLRTRFREICDCEELVLTIRDMSGKVDAVILRRLDRDHSGTVDFFELLKMIYPSFLVKDLQALMRKWDNVETEVVQLPTAQLLSEDSKRQIDIMFRQCDSSNKGVITKQDMMAVFTPKDWEYDEPLWFEKYFPTSSSMIAFDEFMEMVKFCYPPFRVGAYDNKNMHREPFKPHRLPPDLVEAQIRAKIDD